MRLKKAEYVRRKRGKEHLYELLRCFITGGYECAEVEGAAEHYSNMNSAQTTFAHAIKNYEFNGIKASAVDGKLYLVKIDEGGENGTKI